MDEAYPKITVDRDASAAYVYLRHIEDGGVAHTKELGYGIVADFDGDGTLIGIELLEVPKV